MKRRDIASMALIGSALFGLGSYTYFFLYFDNVTIFDNIAVAVAVASAIWGFLRLRAERPVAVRKIAVVRWGGRPAPATSLPRLWRLFSFLLPRETRERVFEPQYRELV